MPDLAVTYADILAAADRVRPHIHRTPLLTSRQLDSIAGAELLFKPEPLQKTGSFKIRGATNAVFSLSDEDAARGVATHSSGNFAAALAQAAAWRGIAAHVVMPDNAPPAKRAATEGYGARIIPCAPTQQAREETLERVVEETGATFLHPYNDPRVIAGQGTAGLELAEDAGALDAVLVPVGGGGLCSGICIALLGDRARPGSDRADSTRANQPNIPPLGEPTGASSDKVRASKPLIYGAEPTGAADAIRSLETGEIQPSVDPRTIADGLKTSLGSLTFPILREHLSGILLADDDQIRAAMALLWSRLKLVVEPSGATVLAALLANRERFAGKRVGLVLSGGNLAVDRLVEAIRL